MEFQHPYINFDSVEMTPLIGSNINILKIKNLDITPNINHSKIDNGKIYIPGKTYLVFFHHKYFHQIIDMFFRYEYFKENFKEETNLHLFINRPIPLFDELNKNDIDQFTDFLLKSDQGQERIIGSDEPTYNKFFENLFEFYLKDNSKVFSLYSSNVLFEEVYLIVDQNYPTFKLRSYPRESQVTQLLMNYETMEIPKIHGICFHEGYGQICESCNFTNFLAKRYSGKIKKHFLSQPHNNFRYPRKIFISRKASNNRIKNAIEECISKKDFGEAEFLKNRLINHHDLIENKYVRKGFKSIDFEGMPLEEQVYYAHYAKEIVGFSGSSLVNVMFCNESTTVVEVNSNNLYSVNYESFIKSFGCRYIKVDISDIEEEHVINSIL